MFVIVCFALIVLSSKMFPHNSENNKYLELNRQLASGEVQRYYTECRDFYSKVDRYKKGSDVVFAYEDMPIVIANVKPYYDSQEPLNPENWVNRDISTYYELNSFIVK